MFHRSTSYKKQKYQKWTRDLEKTACDDCVPCPTLWRQSPKDNTHISHGGICVPHDVTEVSLYDERGTIFFSCIPLIQVELFHGLAR